MDYNEALSYINSLLRFGSRPGLDRIRLLLDKLGNPQKDLKYIHIAGTNGKGSTSSRIALAIIKAGYKTGLYISPFVSCFRDRIQINGAYISEDELAALTGEVKEAGADVTEFEFITAVAFLYFKRMKCDVVVLETGLGGRLDATNVIDSPLAAVITRIDLDHTAVLGSTTEEIAREKCGIIKQGSKVFTTFNQDKSALDVIKQYGCVTVPDAEKLAVVNTSLDGNSFVYKEASYTTRLIGEHQIENAVLAIETLKNCGLSVPQECIEKGIAETEFPGRLELICRSPVVMIDGAHNPNGAAVLAKQMSRFSDVTAVIGMMADKDCNKVLSLIGPLCKKIITVTVTGNARTIQAEKLAVIASQYCKNTVAAANYDDALCLTKGAPTVFIAGSLYLAGDIRQKAKNFY